MDLKLVAVGLISSILTIVIQKLLEIFQKDREHKNELRKTYFEKKNSGRRSCSFSIHDSQVNTHKFSHFLQEHTEHVISSW